MSLEAVVKKEKDWVKNKGFYVSVASFLFFFWSVSYKLTSASLWYDEAIEYWYSRYMVGSLPIPTLNTVGTTNMYQRIITTFQPPLYNFLMYFWLKISETECWFRFFGVLMAMIGVVAIWKSVKTICGIWPAALSVFGAGMIYSLTYYWQECSEYCVMVAALCWALFFWIRVMESPQKGNIIGFVIASVLAVYSQYGAAFPVVVMTIMAFVSVLCRKDREKSIFMLGAYLVAFLFAALPLLYYFILPQARAQQMETQDYPKLVFDGNIIKDILVQLRIVIRWNFFSQSSMMVTNVALVLMVIGIAGVLLWGKKKIVKQLLLLNGIVLVMYYVLVKLGYYGLGGYGNRYNLFMIPCWLITFWGMVLEWRELLLTGYRKYREGQDYLRMSLSIVGIVLTVVYCIFSWRLGLRDNFAKEDHRGAVNAWYETKGQDTPTLVYYGAVPGVAYYLTHDKRYEEGIDRLLIYQDYARNKDASFYEEQLNQIYGADWPGELNLIGSHTLSDWDTLVGVFENKGYLSEYRYCQNDGFLIYLTQK